jgi:PST family polysaccharide transporter
MMNQFKAAWAQNRRVLSNFFSLSVLQVATYLVPLITLPYLVRVLGASRYGLVEFARALAIYFVTLTEYGFNLSATQEISVHRDDSRKVSEIFSAVMVIRLLLLVLSLLALGLMVVGVPKLRAEWLVYLFAFGTVVGQALFPVWLFQGLERMRHIAVLNIAARLLITVSIFVFIRDSDDYIYVPLVQSVGIVFMGVGGLILALRSLSVRFEWPSAAALRHQFAAGWHLFLSRIATTLYTTSNTVILGLLTTDAFVGYYAAGDKIVRAVQGLQLPLSQAIFPHIGRLAAESKAEALKYTERMAKLVGVVTFGLSVGLFFGAPYLAPIVLGPGFEESVPVVQILSFLPFIIGLSGIFGVQIMVNFGMKKALAKILTVAGLVNVVLALVLVLPLRHIGVSIAVLLTETLITVTMYIALHRRGLNVLHRSISKGPDHVV